MFNTVTCLYKYIVKYMYQLIFVWFSTFSCASSLRVRGQEQILKCHFLIIQQDDNQKLVNFCDVVTEVTVRTLF